MSLSSYNGFTLASLEQYAGFRESSSASPTLLVFKKFDLDAEDFSKYVFFSYASDRVNFQINRVLTTYPIGYNGLVASSYTGSNSLYTQYVDWKINSNFLDNYILDLMTQTGSISAYSYSSSTTNGVIALPWVKRDSTNNLIGTSVTPVLAFQTSASAFDGFIIEDIIL